MHHVKEKAHHVNEKAREKRHLKGKTKHAREKNKVGDGELWNSWNDQEPDGKHDNVHSG